MSYFNLEKSMNHNLIQMKREFQGDHCEYYNIMYLMDIISSCTLFCKVSHKLLMIPQLRWKLGSCLVNAMKNLSILLLSCRHKLFVICLHCLCLIHFLGPRSSAPFFLHQTSSWWINLIGREENIHKASRPRIQLSNCGSWSDYWLRRSNCNQRKSPIWGVKEAWDLCCLQQNHWLL